jgi:mono/diheme cytochrome c family protein
MRKSLPWLAALVVVLGMGGWLAYDRFFRWESPTYGSDLEHFKYGSIGNDSETGVPYLVWRVLPTVFPDLLPGAGGYGSLGLVWEKGHSEADAPIGFSKVRVGFERMAINCAFCHTTIARSRPDAEPMAYPTGPSNLTDVQAYQRFLSACASDPRFSPDVLLPAIEAVTPLSVLDRIFYRFLIIPATKSALIRQKEIFAWSFARPLWHAGRIDPFNPVKFDMLRLPDDGTIGNSDMMAVWGLDARNVIRANAPLHWDGLNISIHEVVISSALGDGGRASAPSFFESMDRVERFLRGSRAPASPFQPDPVLAADGAAVFAVHCAECHGNGGSRTLTVVPLVEVGTDRHRTDMWTVAARDAYNAYNQGYAYGFKSFQKIEGYISEPLDGLWLTGPYLHNGSVPTVADLLEPAASRPKAFVRGTTVLDAEKIGFLAPSCVPGQKLDAGYCYDTSEPANSPEGHEYGTSLPHADKAALIAYLKTL